MTTREGKTSSASIGPHTESVLAPKEARSEIFWSERKLSKDVANKDRIKKYFGNYLASIFPKCAEGFPGGDEESNATMRKALSRSLSAGLEYTSSHC